jgi:hypothetical protein
MFHLPAARRLGARRYAIRNLGQGRRYLADPIHKNSAERRYGKIALTYYESKDNFRRAKAALDASVAADQAGEDDGGEAQGVVGIVNAAGKEREGDGEK